MKYSSFSKKKNDTTKEPMFFGESVNIARYDVQKYPIFEKLIEKQISFFWRPEEIERMFFNFCVNRGWKIPPKSSHRSRKGKTMFIRK